MGELNNQSAVAATLEPRRAWARRALAGVGPVSVSGAVLQRGVELVDDGAAIGAVLETLDEATAWAREVILDVEQSLVEPVPERMRRLAFRAAEGDEELARVAVDLASRLDGDVPVLVDPQRHTTGGLVVQMWAGVALSRDAATVPERRERLERPCVLVVDGQPDDSLVEQALAACDNGRTLVVICDRAPAQRSDRAVFWTTSTAADEVVDDVDAVSALASALGAGRVEGKPHRAEAARRRILRARLLVWAAGEGPLGAIDLDRLADLLVEAVLDDDAASLDAAFNALQNRWARERRITGGAQRAGTLLAYIGFARWAQTRVPPAELRGLGSSRVLRDVLGVIANGPAVPNRTLIERLGQPESAVSRAGRRLVELDLAHKTRTGREVMWTATAKGRAAVAVPSRPAPPAERRERCLRSVESVLDGLAEGDFRVLAVALTDAAREHDAPALEEVWQRLAAAPVEDPSAAGRIAGFAALARAGVEQVQPAAPWYEAPTKGGDEALADRILAMVAEHPGLPTSELIERVQSTPTSVSRVCRQLLRDHRLARRSVGREARWRLAPQGTAFDPSMLGEAEEIVHDAGRIVALGPPRADALDQVAVVHVPPELAIDAPRARLLERAIEAAQAGRLEHLGGVRVLDLVPRLLPAHNGHSDAARTLIGALHRTATPALTVAVELDGDRPAGELLEAVTADARAALEAVAADGGGVLR